MPGSADSLLDEATRVLRELAMLQGRAHCTYGEALQRYGANEIDLTELCRATGDSYFKGAEQTFWSLARADLNVYVWMLSTVGTKQRHPEPAAEPAAAPASKPSRRGRR